MVIGELRDSRRGVVAQVHALRPLFETLWREQTGTRQRSLLREVDQIRIFGVEDKAIGNEGQFQVPLLRYTSEARQHADEFGREWQSRRP